MGQKQTFGDTPSNVRYWGKADVITDPSACPLIARNGHSVPINQQSAIPSEASCRGADCEALWLPAQAPKFSSCMGTIFGRTFTVSASRTILGQLASNQAAPPPGHWESIHT